MALRGNEEKNTQTNKLQKSYFDVLGICCSSEIPLIENILKSLDGVKEFSVIVPSRTVIVVHDSLLISPHQIAKALNQARLEANVRINGETSFKKKWPSPFAVVSGGLLLLSFLKYVYPPLRWLAVGSVAAGIFPIMAKAFASIRRFRIDINILVIVAVIATIALKDYTESAAIVFLFTIADWLESRASYKASAVMQSLMNLAPQKAVIAETGEEVEVDEVKINTVVAVKAGETIPIDGVVMDGNCEVDEKTLTGEAFPVPKQRDSTVWAGTINLNGYISVKTTALAEDCVVAKMAKLVEEAQNSKTKTQRFIDQCSQYYTPAVVIISTCFAVVPVALRVHNLRHWFHLALVVLVSACPCGLVLSTPVATFCALTKAATSGLLIKGGDYLETLSKIKIAAFDKTGTITRGEFIVMDFRSLSRDISVHTLLYWVSSVESKSSHPMAAALVDYAKSVSVDPKPDAVEEYQNFPGEGIYGSIDGKDVFIGNKRIASRAGCSTEPDIEVDRKGGKTVGYIYVGERLSGVFNLSDACRSGVVQAMKELKSLGVKTAMLTGDNQAAAMHAQEQLGNALEVVHAELLPEDKARIIEQFKKEGLTAMVGDGLNDAPALATADIGISMGISGSALATQTGHIILMSNDIRKIPEAIKLARRAHQKVIQNVMLSIVIKGGILILAFSGHPLIWAAVLADVGTCLLVILNSMLLLQEKNHSGKKCCRASPPALLTQKLEGGGNHDIETGLLGKRGDGHCNSSCCGENMGEKAVRPASTVEGLNRKRGSDHCHSGCCDTQPSDLRQAQKVKHLHNDSGCCGDKTTQGEEKIGSSSSCKKSALLEKDLQVKSNSNCRSGCCANKNDEAKSCCEKPDGTERAQPMKITENKTSCCQKKVQTEEILIQTFAENPAELRMKTDGNCKSSCCGKKEKAEEKILLPKEQRSDLEKSLQKKTEGTCKSGCCSSDKQTMETAKPAAVRKTDNQDFYSECCSNKHKEEQSSHEKTAEANCESVCCDNDVEGVGGAEGKHEGSVKSTSMERGLQLKDDQNCRSSCCRSKQEMERTLNQSCCSSPVDILLQAKSGSHSKSSCCERNDEAKEQSCCLEKSPEACRSKCGGGERRHNNGGCCRSFAKECCSHGHVGAAGFGGLTEIVIE